MGDSPKRSRECIVQTDKMLNTANDDEMNGAYNILCVLDSYLWRKLFVDHQEITAASVQKTVDQMKEMILNKKLQNTIAADNHFRKMQGLSLRKN